MNGKSGFVYIVRNAEGLYKIGRTKNVERRIRSLQIASSSKLVLVHAIKADNARDLERTLHDGQSDRKVSGEWFRIPDWEIEVIKTIGYMPASYDEEAWAENAYDLWVQNLNRLLILWARP